MAQFFILALVSLSLFLTVFCVLVTRSGTLVLIRQRVSATQAAGAQRIPRIIHQSHKYCRLPARLASNLKLWYHMNPEYEYRYYDDSNMDAYMQAYADFVVPGSLSAYNTMRVRFPRMGALASDIFRLVLVSREGGVWADADARCRAPLRNFISPEDEFVSGIGQRGDPHQWCFAAVPRHPFILETLRRSISSIRSDTPLRGPWPREEGYAGPPQMHAAVNSIAAPFVTNVGVHHIPKSRYTYTILDGDMMGGNVGFKYKGYIQDVKQLGGYWATLNGAWRDSMAKALETD